MNQQFPAVRSPSTGTNFYNVKKNNFIPNAPSSQNVESNPPTSTSTNSKSLISRSNIFEQPKNNSSSGYVKSSN